MAMIYVENLTIYDLTLVLWFCVILFGVFAEPISHIGNWMVRMRHAGRPIIHRHDVMTPSTDEVISDDGIGSTFWSEYEP